MKKITKNLKKNYDKKTIRTLKDLKNCFLDKEKVKQILKKRNPIIYRVYIRKIDNLNIGLTIIKPGTITNEYYFTKGHKHDKPSTEIYILIKGKGKLVLGDKIITLQKNKRFKISGTSLHRLINIGDTNLEVLTIYDPKAGHDYKVEFKKRIFKK
jgi:oxalate decarboxylase/phosphoglucose isomerase-like protein (cupin superfamily)